MALQPYQFEPIYQQMDESDEDSPHQKKEHKEN